MSDSGPVLECKDQAKDLTQVRGQGSGLRGNERSGFGGIPILEGCLGLQLGHHSPPLTHLQFASIQLQELGPVHLSCSKLSDILLQVEAVQPLAHLLAGPVVDRGERFVQELG